MRVVVGGQRGGLCKKGIKRKYRGRKPGHPVPACELLGRGNGKRRREGQSI